MTVCNGALPLDHRSLCFGEMTEKRVGDSREGLVSLIKRAKETCIRDL